MSKDEVKAAMRCLAEDLMSVCKDSGLSCASITAINDVDSADASGWATVTISWDGDAVDVADRMSGDNSASHS